jgi:hypothetical protein
MLAPNFADVRRGACPAQKVADADLPTAPETSPAEYLERMNGRCRLDVPSVRGEHKVEMRGTVPAEWSLL